MGLLSFLKELARADNDCPQCRAKDCNRPVALNPWTGNPRGSYCEDCRADRRYT